jgi:hypothetical protein
LTHAATIHDDDERERAQIERTNANVYEVFARLADDPSVTPELLDRVRFACQQAWKAGWFTRDLDRRNAQLTPNPFDPQVQS